MKRPDLREAGSVARKGQMRNRRGLRPRAASGRSARGERRRDCVEAVAERSRARLEDQRRLDIEGATALMLTIIDADRNGMLSVQVLTKSEPEAVRLRDASVGKIVAAPDAGSQSAH